MIKICPIAQHYSGSLSGVAIPMEPCTIHFSSFSMFMFVKNVFFSHEKTRQFFFCQMDFLDEGGYTELSHLKLHVVEAKGCELKI